MGHNSYKSDIVSKTKVLSCVIRLNFKWLTSIFFKKIYT